MASVAAAAVATEPGLRMQHTVTLWTRSARYAPLAQAASGVLRASLLLPGLAALAVLTPLPAAAENAPEKTTIAFKYGDYKDWQSGWDRIKVTAPQLYVQAPIAGEWAIEGSWVGDSVSGATPRWYSERSGATQHMHDYRKASDVKVTRYLARAAVSASVAYSHEHDYTSRALGLDARWSSDDNNRTWTVGFGHSGDVIDNTSNGVNTAINQHKRTNEIMAGVTQVLTPTDIGQFNLTRSVGSGYYNDPYKSFDLRPRQRNAWIALARWNHYLEPFNASVRSSYRYYSDSFGVKSHTAGLEWVQPVGPWTFTPGVRYYSQTAARFYADPVFTAQGSIDLAPLMALYGQNRPVSADQRLAAFGASTVSLKAAYAFTPDVVVDAKIESYRQSAGRHLGGGGSPGLAPFSARFMQVGLTYRF